VSGESGLSRRDCLRLGLGAAAAAGIAACAPGGARATPPAGAPNVLFIAIDDLNGWVGCLGGDRHADTPHMDALAARGVAFTNAHCPAPLCNPSRSGVLSGVAPAVSGIYRQDQPLGSALPGRPTLLDHFYRAGWRVVTGGKVFHDRVFGRFDEAYPSRWIARPLEPLPPRYPMNGLPPAGDFDWGPLDVDDDATGDGRVAAWAERHLASPSGAPWFCSVGLFRPHLPWYVPRRYFERYGPGVQPPEVFASDLDDVPEAGRALVDANGRVRVVRDAGVWLDLVRGFAASVSFCDAMVGRILDALERGPHAARTVVVVWSDHGFHLGEKQHLSKTTLWEESTRVPLILAGPGVADSGMRCTRAVGLLDLLPTLLELCGLDTPDELAGRSLAPLLRDPAREWDRPAVTTWGLGNHAVRSNRWRYIRYRDGSQELYDHGADAHEWRNLAGRPELAPVVGELSRWLPAADAPEAPGRSRWDEWRDRAVDVLNRRVLRY
jgi:arylsulfatase A-like enzyme